MKKKSIWLLLGLLIVTLTLAFTACGPKKEDTSGCRLEYESLALKTGETWQLNVLNNKDEALKSVTWSSEEPEVASVSKSGLVTAVAEGTTSITAKVKSETLVCTVTVAQSYTYSLDKTEVELAVGATDRITLITTPDGGTFRPHTFTSSDTSVVSVEGGTGKLTGVGKGTAVITCSVDGEELTANVSVVEYIIKVNDTALTEGMELAIGESYQINVTSDPVRENISATYASSDETILTISESGAITLKRMGDVTISVTVGGKTVTTTVTVVSAYSINYTEYTLVYASAEKGSVQLAVSGSDTPTVTYTSDDTSVATVSDSGLVTATGVGTAVIKSAITEELYFETTITVAFGVVQSEVDYPNSGVTVNLDALSDTQTLDWIYYGKENYIEHKNGGDLLGEFSGTKEPDFFDYRVGINWSDGTVNATNSSGRTDGITLKSGSFTVKVTSDVKYIAIFTGVYHGTNTTTISYNGIVCASVTFENAGNNDAVNKNKQIIFTPDVENLIGTEMEFTVSFQVGAESSNGWADNISLVAVAVVGNEAREVVGPSATVDFSNDSVKALENKTYDLSAVGNEDWVYANNNGSMARKTGVSNVIKENDIAYSGNPSGNDSFSVGSFTWNATDATAAPAGGSVSKFLWVNTTYSIPVHLTEGTHTVTLYLSGWNCSYLLSVLDGHDNVLIDAHQLVTHDGENNHAVEVKVTLNVTREDDFTFRMTRSADSPSNGNHGWAAIAVSREASFEVTQSEYKLVVGGKTTDTIVLTGTTTGLTYTSNDTDVVTVANDGTITAVGAGSTYITISDGTAQVRVYVTVTEYTLESAAELILPLEATSQIVIAANPEGAFTATYVSSNDDAVEVSGSGLITAKQKVDGIVTITVTVEGVQFEIKVTVVAYKLSQTNITLKVGGTAELTVTTEDGEPVEGVTFDTDDEKIATVNSSTGAITAVGVGTTAIIAKIGDAEIRCTVTVIIPDPETELVNIEWSIQNLSRISDEYKTIDYKHWSANDTPTEMPGRENLIGTPSSMSGNFWDYKASIGYVFQENSIYNVGTTYGKTSNGFELPVTISNAVSEIVFYTGAYKGTATVTFKMGDRVLGTQSFTADEGVARKVSIKLDTTTMREGATDVVTIVGSIEKTDGNGNINVVAVAVIGRTAYDNAIAATGSAERTQLGEKGEYKVDLDVTGSYDWIYSHYQDPNDQTYRKFDGHNVFTGESYYDNNGNPTGAGQQWDGRAAFKWTNGVRSDLADTAESGSVNPVDNDGPWDASAEGGVDGYTNNYFDANGEIHIQMRLAPGTYTVNVYLNSWRSPLATGIYDGNNNFITGKLVINQDLGDNEGQGWYVTYTLEVKEESTFKLVIGKPRSHDNDFRKVAWQAVAIVKND